MNKFYALNNINLLNKFLSLFDGMKYDEQLLFTSPNSENLCYDISALISNYYFLLLSF